MASNGSLGVAIDSTTVAKDSYSNTSDHAFLSSRKASSSLPRRTGYSTSAMTSTKSSIPRKPLFGHSTTLSAKSQAQLPEDARQPRSSPAIPHAAERQALQPSIRPKQPRGGPHRLEFGQSISRPTTLIAPGSLLSAPEIPKKNVLRRKPSVIGSYIAQRRLKESTGLLEADASQPNATNATDQVYGLGLSSETQYQFDIDRSPQEASPSIVGPRSVLSAAPTHDLRPFQTPTPLSNLSVTPSLIFTDSPSGFSHRTTPNSYPSYSPRFNDSPQIDLGHWPSSTNINATDTTANVTKQDSSAVRISRTPGNTQALPSVAASNLPMLPTKRQAGPKHPKVRTPPPELAHLMVDPISARGTLDATKSDSAQKQKVAAQKSLPRLDTFVGNDSNAQKRSSVPVTDEAAKKAQIKRKTINPSVPQTHPKSTTTPSQPKQVNIKSPQDKSSNGRTTPSTEASQKASSRFGFFARKKSAITSSTDEVARHGRKGPVAGTGYEGLGRYASRRKSGSSTNVSSVTHQSASSTTSSSRLRTSGSRKSDESSLDIFLQQRLNPVYIRGDGNSSEPHARTSESTADDDPSGTVFTSPRTAVSSQSSTSTPILLPGSATTTSDIGLETMKSIDTELALRAKNVSLERLSVAGTSPPLSEDATRPSTAGPILSVADSDAGFRQALPRPSVMQEIRNSSNDSVLGVGTIDGIEGEANIKSPILSAKVKHGSRWNWFSRSKISLTDSELDNTANSPNTEAALDVRATPKTTAHYAIFDGSSIVDFEDLQSIMEEADRAYWESRPTRGKLVSNNRLDQSPALGIPGTFRLDGSPVVTPAATEVYSQYHFPFTLDNTRGSSESERSSNEAIELTQTGRLTQVERSPQVTQRDRKRQLSAQSFSRPFVDFLRMPDHKVPQSVANVHEPTTRQSHDGSSEDPGIQYAIGAVAGIDELMPLPLSVSGKVSPEKSFFELSTRKNSQASFSSSSRTSFIHTVAATAVLPSPGAPLSPDEVWDEYDDLIAYAITPLSGQPLAPEPGNSLRSKVPDSADNSQTAAQSGDTCTVLSPSTTLEMHESAGSTSSLSTNGAAQHARKPSNASSSSSRKRQSLLPRRSDLSTISQRATKGLALLDDTGSAQPSSPSSTRSRTSGFADPMSMANLRFGALMVSKWLSFGRVLVSPAHAELENSITEERMLIYDGLGKDWSYYCALTYSNAQVYSLGPWSAKSANRHSLGGGLDQLPNYRHFCHPDLGANMPFPKAFFSVVVLRFPAVTTEAALRNAISECKRILRPGGHIEISTLDLDLNNMGNKGRRELRELKTKIHAGNPEACLRSASDSLQYLLGRKGFDNLRRCFVGVPVAGVVSGSRDASRDERVGILELMRDSSEQGDRDITKMVAKVGRWWYSRCYEQGALPDGDLGASMWNDGELLRECEAMGTTFKLLICYAQKPTVIKRRAVSL